MIYFLITAVLFVLLMVITRFFAHFKITTLQAITFNYITVSVVGLLFSDWQDFPQIMPLIGNWLPQSAAMGVLFVGAFYLTGLATQKIGITTTALSVRTSLMIPVLFSLFVFKNMSKTFDFWNYGGLFLALFAIFLSVYRKTDAVEKQQAENRYLLPLLIFVSSGFVDTAFNYANMLFQTEAEAKIFPVFLTFFAFLSGFSMVLYQFFAKKQPIRFRNILAGILLGVPNYFSFYFFFKTISAFQNDGAFLFPIFNISVILLSTFVGLLFFRERLIGLNWIGIGWAILAIVMIAYQEIGISF